MSVNLVTDVQMALQCSKNIIEPLSFVLYTASLVCLALHYFFCQVVTFVTEQTTAKWNLFVNYKITISQLNN